MNPQITALNLRLKSLVSFCIRRQTIFTIPIFFCIIFFYCNNPQPVWLLQTIDLSSSKISSFEEERVVRGGLYTESGWQSLSESDQIRIHLKQGFCFNRAGAIELDVTNYDPVNQYVGRKQHFFSVYGGPSGDQMRTDDEVPFFNFRNGTDNIHEDNYGIKILWSPGSKERRQETHGTFRKFQWDKTRTYTWRAEWTKDEISFFLDGDLLLGPVAFDNRPKPFDLSYIFLADDNNGPVWTGMPGKGLVYRQIRLYRKTAAGYRQDEHQARHAALSNAKKADYVLYPHDVDEYDYVPIRFKYRDSKKTEKIWIETETGEIHQPFSVRFNKKSSNMYCISVFPALVRFKVDIRKTGLYKIWLNSRTYEQQAQCLVRMDSKVWTRIIDTGANAWQWYSHSDPIQINRGSRMLDLLLVDNNAMITQVLVTDNLTAAPNQLIPDGILVDANDGKTEEPVVLNQWGLHGMKYAYVPDKKSFFHFNIQQGGLYKILFRRIVFHGDNQDTFSMQVDNGPEIRFDSMKKEDGWVWSNPVKDSSFVLFHLNPGPHAIYLKAKEDIRMTETMNDAMLIDKILITNQLIYQPKGFGEPAQ